MSDQTAADRVAAALRLEVIEGRLRSGMRLRDQEISLAHDVSRNTAREALRIIVRDGLAVSRLNSGASVRRLGADDVHDIYEVRRMLEGAAIDRAPSAPEHVFDELRAIVAETERQEQAENWIAVGTSGVRFHQGIIRLAQSPLIEDFFANIVAQLRLALALMPDEAEFQRLWTPRDREILDLLLAGRRDQARRELMAYLDEAESCFVESVRAIDRRR